MSRKSQWRQGRSLIGVVLCGHDHLASSLLESAAMIMGPQSAVIPVALEPTANLEALHECIGEAISEVEQRQGVLVLLDLYGGTPSNATALHFQNAQIEAVAGVNLPMLLEVLCSRNEKSLGDLAAYAEEIGHQGVVNVP